MGETRKFIGRNQGKHGSDEPEILADALAGQRQSGNYRGSAERPEKRGTGVAGRVRKVGSRPREESKLPAGKKG